ncbi:hypothetical protein MLD38_020539 [Melastoma candidum]|uniref:Uncharacterized protein n=1 Tax=Melastoma candidum TaxID=119954 RepID=A0ACB9QEG7_9MYRT|nr:hypothetical protein MLD38_020539 [Melastoma candidum]
MARSLASAKSVVSSLADNLFLPVASRRGFAVSPAVGSGGVFSGGGYGGGMPAGGLTRKMDQAAGGSARESPWAPDPVTGYYRPADRAVEIDAAELRAMLLNPKAKN